MSVESNIKKLLQELPNSVRLVAVSKFKPIADIEQAYQAGQRDFGESKALELRDKHEALPKDIRWHFIGHLQTNKIKYIAPFVSLIHSVDSENLLQEINKHAEKCERTIDCLLQLHIATEETKFGLSFEECDDLLDSLRTQKLTNVRIRGLMGMASNTDDMVQVEREFSSLKAYFDKTKTQFFPSAPDFDTLSMGMSHDYALAIRCGATMVRVGSLLFGERNYNEQH